MDLILDDSSKFSLLNRNASPEDISKNILKLETKMNNDLRGLKNDSFIDEATYKSLYASGSQPGLLYGLPKTHKQDVPLRPILSAINTFNYKLAKFLVPLLCSITSNQYTVKDSFSFAKEIANLSFPNVTMASFDVKSLYTNIPLEETISICTSTLSKAPLHSLHVLPHILHKLLSFATKDSLFMFNSHLYKQLDGIAMGSPLGPSLANAFLCFWEEKWLEECPDAFRPLYYRRYIDDTFILFKCPSHVPLFLDFLNSRHPSIEFTVDIERNHSLSFLDVTVTHDSSGKFSTSLYRKPTYTGLISLFSSFGPTFYKSNLISALVHRAWHLSSSYKNLDCELKFLAKLFNSNGYPSPFFYRHLSRTLNKFFKPPVLNYNVPRTIIYFPLEYYGRASIQFKNKLLPPDPVPIPLC